MEFKLDVIYEDREFLAVNKPSGLIVHQAGSKNQKPKIKSKASLADLLLNKYPEIRNVGDEPMLRPGIVHRLDRETSGVMIVAKTQESFEYLKNLFSARGGQPLIKKTYLALVLGRVVMKSGTISKPIGLKKGTIKRTTYNKNAKLVKEAITKFEVINNFKYGVNDLTLMKITPLTGRTHQIRVHLNSINHPVLGDKLYGGKNTRELAEKLNLKRHFLHAETIEFTDLGGKRINISANLPLDLKQVLSLLSPGHQDLDSHN